MNKSFWKDCALKYKYLIMLWTLLVVGSKYVNIGFLVGKHAASLSALAICIPLIGYFFRTRISLILSASAWILTHLSLTIPITMGIPTLAATLSWSASKGSAKNKKSFMMHVALPLFCMLLFYFSPSGKGAWSYSLYWLVPIIFYFISFKGVFNLLGRALQSTFLAHAVGSVLWAYIVPMSASQWIALIPVVAIERFIMAGVSSLLICLLSFVYEQSMVKKSEKIFTSP